MEHQNIHSKLFYVASVPLMPRKKMWSEESIFFVWLHIYSADVGFERYKPDTRAQIYPDGTVIWYAPVIYTVSCKIRVTWFPSDTQVCDYDICIVVLHWIVENMFWD